MKKYLCLFISLVMIMALLTACKQPESSVTPNTEVTPTAPTSDATPTPPPLQKVEAENTLTGADSKITLAVINSKLYITYLGTTKSNVNMIAENSVFEFPKYFRSNEYTTQNEDLNWNFSECKSYSDNVNGVLTTGIMYTFEEKVQNLQMNVYCVTRPEIKGPFEFYTTIKNKNSNAFRIVPGNFASFAIDTPDQASTILMKIAKEDRASEGYPLGDNPDGMMYNEGTGIYRTPVSEVKKEIAETWVSSDSVKNSGDILAYYIDRNSVDGIFTAFEWSHGRIIAEKASSSSLQLSIDMDSGFKVFSTKIPADFEFVFPSAYIMPYDGDVDDGSNKFKSWFFQCKTKDKLRNDENEPLLQMDIMDYMLQDILDAGIESVKWDLGWWRDSNTNVGSWLKLRHQGYIALINSYGCETLDQFGKLLNDNDINFTIYILLNGDMDEDDFPNDAEDEFNSWTHPDWFTSKYGDAADLGSVDCVNHIKERLKNFFIENYTNTWRTDFQPIPRNSQTANRHDANGTDVQYWCTVGMTEILDYLYDNVKDFRWENCSTGGELKNLYSATRATVIQCDDTANYASFRTAFYDSSYVFHPTQLLCLDRCTNFYPNAAGFYPYIEAPNADDDYDFNKAMINLGYRSTILGATHWCDSKADTFEYYKIYSDIYKNKVRPLIRNGELYHILPRPDGINWDGVMYADPDTENEIKGAVFLFKPSAEANDTYNVVFKGLDENKTYKLTFEDRPEQNCTVSGKSLMTDGLNVEIKYIGSEIIWITE